MLADVSDAFVVPELESDDELDGADELEEPESPFDGVELAAVADVELDADLPRLSVL